MHTRLCTKFTFTIGTQHLLSFYLRNVSFLPFIVRDAHYAVGLNGLRDILCHVRKRFWIPRLRHVVKNLSRTCALFKRYESKSIGHPSTSALPAFHLSLNFAFTNIGIDWNRIIDQS